MRIVISMFLLFLAITLQAQGQDSLQNSAEKILNEKGKLVIGGYGEVHYNQELNKDIKYNGNLDVHRMVMLMGYKFNPKTQFITEIEFEHVKELYVEQAFLQYKINSLFKLRGGLLLIPMGIINEYHEPTLFNGVERPLIDKYITPGTWREIGLGVNGNIIAASLKYQLYLVNGFNGYDGSTLFNGKNGLRKGRQKGAESYISSPALTGRVEYYGLKGTRLGLSAYYGSSQSTLFDGIEKNDTEQLAKADSSVVAISMLGADLRYQNKGLKLTGQFYLTALDNTDEYNSFGGGSDLANMMNGFYVEAAYDIFRKVNSIETSLSPFIRYSNYDTHFQVNEGLSKNESYHKSVITAGLSWYPSKRAVVKTDIQFINDGSENASRIFFNAGFGVMF